MSFLSSQRQHSAAAADDIEAQAAARQNDPHPEPAAGIAPTAASDTGGGGGGERVTFSRESQQKQEAQQQQQQQPSPKSADLGEFEALDRFITTFEQERRASLASTAMSAGKRKRWWQFWKSDEHVSQAAERPAADVGKPPPAWLETDVLRGVDSSVVEERRKGFGWNELTSEKEDMLAKVFGYFTGPILYGTLRGFLRSRWGF